MRALLAAKVAPTLARAACAAVHWTASMAAASTARRGAQSPSVRGTKAAS